MLDKARIALMEVELPFLLSLDCFLPPRRPRARLRSSLSFYYLLIASLAPCLARCLARALAFYYLLIASSVFTKLMYCGTSLYFLLSLDCFRHTCGISGSICTGSSFYYLLIASPGAVLRPARAENAFYYLLIASVAGSGGGGGAAPPDFLLSLDCFRSSPPLRSL